MHIGLESGADDADLDLAQLFPPSTLEPIYGLADIHQMTSVPLQICGRATPFAMTGLGSERRINAIGVIETLADAMLFEGIPSFIRSDNGPEMVAKVLRQWLSGLGTSSLYIELVPSRFLGPV